MTHLDDLMRQPPPAPPTKQHLAVLRCLDVALDAGVTREEIKAALISLANAKTNPSPDLSTLIARVHDGSKP